MKNDDASDERSLEDEQKARRLFDIVNAESPAANQGRNTSRGTNAMLTNIDKITGSANSVKSMLPTIDKLTTPLAATLARFTQLDRLLRPSESTMALLANIEQYALPSESTRAMLANIEQIARPSESTMALLASIEQYARPSESVKSMLANIEQYARPSESTRVMLASIEQFARTSESTKAMLASIENLLEPRSFRKSVLRSVESLQQFPVFDFLSSADPKVIASLVDVSSGSDLNVLNEGKASQEVKSATIADVELLRALQTAKEDTKLSLPALGLLLLLLHSIHSMYVMVAQWHDFRESVCDIQERLHGVASLSQARKTVRSLLCESPQELANNFRLVTGDRVNLRDGPSMQSKVIIDLLKYTPVEVLDSTDRTWLHVRYKHGGVRLEGWITRSYVSPMSK
ncbi:SH3 domain-containing protein [Pseudomonas sp. PICF6]|uniref:SH3 domain-containing protein n=1 Tax=Pseudomonas sp. PICF6 TaxID=2664172 RepID=UPI001368C024|nr:SH3 domain-containing protein [Pseudomonas sp. PICF6]MXR29000.1 SH3 domain-containing protein [Pseudomonas sp. PICF6]